MKLIELIVTALFFEVANNNRLLYIDSQYAITFEKYVFIEKL